MGWLNLPNLLSLARLALAPFVFAAVLAGRDWTALAILAVAAATDVLDGPIARRMHCVTRWGAYADPIADKVLLSSSYVALGIAGLVPWWLVGLIFGRDLLILALAGTWRERRWRTWLLAGTALAGLLLALGNAGFAYAWLKQVVPAISFSRYPIKFVALPVFAIPLLAACGFNSLQSASPEGSRRGQRSLILLGGLLLLVAGGTLWAARCFPEPEDSWPVTWQSALTRMLFLAGFIAVVCALLRVRTQRLRGLLAIAIVALVGLDLTTAGMRLHPTVVTRAFGPLEFNMSFRPRLGEARALVSRRTSALLTRLGIPDLVSYCVGIRGALFENSNLLEGIPKVDGFCSLPLKEQVEVFSVLNGGTNSLAGPLADFLGVAQVTVPENLFAWQSRSNFLPVVTAGQQPLFAGETETLEAVATAEFAPRREVYLPTTARAEVRATKVADARITSTQWAAQCARFSVEASTPAMAVIAQSFHHNWRAFVDGRPARLWPMTWTPLRTLVLTVSPVRAKSLEK